MCVHASAADPLEILPIKLDERCLGDALDEASSVDFVFNSHPNMVIINIYIYVDTLSLLAAPGPDNLGLSVR